MYFLVLQCVSGVFPMQEGKKKYCTLIAMMQKQTSLYSDVNILTIVFARISKKSFGYIIKK